MRSYKTTIIALVVLVVAIGAFIATSFLLKDKKSDDDENQNTAVYLFDGSAEYDKKNVSAIEAKNTETFSLYVEDENWFCKNHTDLPIYTKSVEDIIDDFLVVRGTEIKTFDSLSDYKIDENSPYTRIIYKDGTALTLRFGSKDNKDMYRYIVVDGRENTVYRIQEATASKIMVTIGLLVRLSAFEISDEFYASHLTITKKDENVVTATGVFVENGGDDGSDTVEWSVIKPISIKGNDENINTLVNRLTGVNLASMVEYHPDLSEYGISDTSTEYFIMYSNSEQKNESRSIKLGNKKDKDYYYCIIDGDERFVYTISAEWISNDIKVEDYVDGTMFMEMYNVLKKVELTFEGKTYEMKYVFKKQGDEEIEERYFDNQFVPDEDEDEDYNTAEDYFNRLLTALYAIELSKVEPVEPAEKGESLCKVVYTRQDNSTVTIEVFKRDNTTAYIYKNGEYSGGYFRTGVRLYGEYTNFGVKGSLAALKNALATS